MRGRGGGSKAVWNFSENSSILEGKGVPKSVVDTLCCIKKYHYHLFFYHCHCKIEQKKIFDVCVLGMVKYLLKKSLELESL